MFDNAGVFAIGCCADAGDGTASDEPQVGHGRAHHREVIACRNGR